MTIYTADDMSTEDIALTTVANGDPLTTNAFSPDMFIDGTSPDDTSIVHFCEFVDFYTRHARNPMCTALTCEKQAEAIRITDQDLSPETLQLLLDTMLTAIDHLEKKWLDEQLQHEDVRQRSWGNSPQRSFWKGILRIS